MNTHQPYKNLTDEHSQLLHSMRRYFVVRTLAFGVDVPGYASLLTAVLFLGGVQREL